MTSLKPCKTVKKMIWNNRLLCFSPYLRRLFIRLLFTLLNSTAAKCARWGGVSMQHCCLLQDVDQYLDVGLWEELLTKKKKAWGILLTLFVLKSCEEACIWKKKSNITQSVLPNNHRALCNCWLMALGETSACSVLTVNWPSEVRGLGGKHSFIYIFIHFRAIGFNMESRVSRDLDLLRNDITR